MLSSDRQVLRLLALMAFAITAVGKASELRPPARAGSLRGSIPEARQEFAEAKKLLEQGLLENAQAAAQKGLEADPRSVEGYDLLGIIDTERKD